MQYNFVYYNKTDDYKLTNLEKVYLQGLFPNANVENIYKLGPATYDYTFIHSENALLPELCREYGCNIVKKKYLEAEIGGIIKLIEVPTELCLDSKFKCLDFNKLSLSYNCIGWALGIRTWINPVLESGQPVRKNDLNKFLDKVNTQYLDEHLKNVFQISNDYVIGSESCLIPNTYQVNEHDVAFYFKNNVLTHGSRYEKFVSNKAINSWTSKLGDDLLISHGLTGLNDYTKNSSYGIAECMAVYFTGQQHDEL